MSMHRKKTVAAITGALLHHEQMTAAAMAIMAPTPSAEPFAPPHSAPAAACGQPHAAWSFSGRYEIMSLRVQRQAKRAG